MQVALVVSDVVSNIVEQRRLVQTMKRDIGFRSFTKQVRRVERLTRGITKL